MPHAHGCGCMIWNKSKMGRLRRMWRRGEPALTIAEALGGGVTKNMVIGKARRMNLPMREKSVAMAIWWEKRGKPLHIAKGHRL